jgi:hypothetical protein
MHSSQAHFYFKVTKVKQDEILGVELAVPEIILWK